MRRSVLARGKIEGALCFVVVDLNQLGRGPCLLVACALAATGRYDQQIQQAVSMKVQDSKQLKNVQSSVDDGIVTLNGTVNLYQDKLDAAKKVKKLANVSGVRNQIMVAGETVSDAQLQLKLAKKLAYDRVGYRDNAFNYLAVGVQDGVVTLSGETINKLEKSSGCGGPGSVVTARELASEPSQHATLRRFVSVILREILRQDCFESSLAQARASRKQGLL